LKKHRFCGSGDIADRKNWREKKNSKDRKGKCGDLRIEGATGAQEKIYRLCKWAVSTWDNAILIFKNISKNWGGGEKGGRRGNLPYRKGPLRIERTRRGAMQMTRRKEQYCLACRRLTARGGNRKAEPPNLIQEKREGKNKKSELG